jgi:(S)-ureidoglycine aminohydrolase
MTTPTGLTRSTVQPDHAVIAPDSHVRSPLPGWTNSSSIILISPRMGAQFSQYIVEMDKKGKAGPPPLGVERFFYVIDGTVKLTVAGGARDLGPRAYGFIPQGESHQLVTRGGATVMVIEKEYIPVDGHSASVVVGSEKDAPATPFMGDERVLVQMLLPDAPGFDMAVNTMAFAPGASLPLVEVHVMEHGLTMLEGSMVYRLGDSWYPVHAGDVVFMAPYCPQWAAAYGKGWAKYLLYKDWHRDPLIQP